MRIGRRDSCFAKHSLLGMVLALLVAGPWTDASFADHVSSSECRVADTLNTIRYQAGLTAARGAGAWDGSTNDGIWIADSDVHCLRVSSLIVRLNSLSMVEIGWVENPLGVADSSCNPTTQPGKPHGLFLVEIEGLQTCSNLSGTYWTASQWQDFRVENPDPDWEYWSYYVSGAQKAYRFAGFTTAPHVRANGERHGYWDTAWSHFKGLRYKSSGGNWFRWSESYEAGPSLSDDPFFHTCAVGGDDADIIVQQAPC